MAYYFAQCIVNEEFNARKLKERTYRTYALLILNFYLAETSLSKSLVTKTNPYYKEKISGDLELEFNNIEKTDFHILADLASYIRQVELENFEDYFEDEFIFINELGRKKLIKEYKDIAREFNIH